ncbi:MAG: hypothetical protein HGGPFJEG_03040 [Ignavibacteria bacterium]|nr:hypothetical protein [Ignavibacteria bacterium]
MKHLLRIFIPLIAIFVFVNFYYHDTGLLKNSPGYPVWMKDVDGNKTDQTSGLNFTGVKNTKKIFISADDIGKINRITVDESVNPPTLFIEQIHYSENLKELFSKFKKTDIEEIIYDSTTKKIYISIEGHEYSSNDPEIYKKKEGIYEITFNKDIYTTDTLQTIKRLELPKEIYKYTFDNISFEGFSATRDYFFIGLENFQTPKNEFTDSTVIYIINRKTKELHQVNTRELKISSISGLFAKDNFNLYGIDRNRRNVFYIRFSQDFTPEKTEIMTLDLPVPNHPEMNKLLGTAPESITFDHDNNFYVAIDPWKDVYKPDITERKKLSKDELNNFNEFVPILYKFKNEFK